MSDENGPKAISKGKNIGTVAGDALGVLAPTAMAKTEEGLAGQADTPLKIMTAPTPEDIQDVTREGEGVVGSQKTTCILLRVNTTIIR